MIYTQQDYNNFIDIISKLINDSVYDIRIHIIGKGWLGTSTYNIIKHFDQLDDLDVKLYGREIYDQQNHTFSDFLIANDNIKHIGLPKRQIKHIVINTAAKTNTRYCERNENLKQVMEDNVIFPEMLEKYLDSKRQHQHNVHLVAISTGCIYDGNNHYIVEYESPNPKIVYSRTKAEAEVRLSEAICTTILRPRMPFHEDFILNANNIFYKVASFSECIDEKNSMTYLLDIVLTILYAIHKEIYGTYNVVNSGHYSPYKIATEVWQKNVKLITKEQMFDKLKIYLTNTLLSNDKLLKNLYPDMPTLEQRWKQMREHVLFLQSVILRRK